MSEQFNCPLSGVSLCHPCPVVDCPSNFADLNPSFSCAQQLVEINHASLANLVGLETAEVKRSALLQTTALGELMIDLKFAVEHVVDNAHACPNCGYVDACKSSSLCLERRETVEQIRVKCWGESKVGLKKSQIWFALVKNRTSFLTSDDVARLEELVSQQHLER